MKPKPNNISEFYSNLAVFSGAFFGGFFTSKHFVTVCDESMKFLDECMNRFQNGSNNCEEDDDDDDNEDN